MRSRLLPMFQRLAIAAMLALVSVPTLGRMGQGGNALEAEPVSTAPAHAMHHGAHADHAVTVPEAPSPAPHHGTSGDCEYCPLLQGLLTPGIAPLATVVALAPTGPRIPRAEARFDVPHPTGLGSRGPPIA